MIRPLAVWDVDGTLVDSRETITAAVQAGFAAIARPAPDYGLIRQIVGLNLAEALEILAPGLDANDRTRLTEGYRAYFWSRHEDPAFKEPLFEGAAETLERLRADGWRIAMATGKSRRGVDSIVRMHDWAEVFESTHCAEDGPGKPDPAMLVAAMRACDSTPAATVMIGDTAHDIRMARAAGVRAQGVAWGFHTAEEVAASGADHVADDWAELNGALDRFAAALRT